MEWPIYRKNEKRASPWRRREKMSKRLELVELPPIGPEDLLPLNLEELPPITGDEVELVFPQDDEPQGAKE